MPTTTDVAGFLADLTQLSRKYGLVLWSCGCCEGINTMRAPAAPMDPHHLYRNSDCAGYRVRWTDTGYTWTDTD